MLRSVKGHGVRKIDFITTIIFLFLFVALASTNFKKWCCKLDNTFFFVPMRRQVKLHERVTSSVQFGDFAKWSRGVSPSFS